MNRLRTFVGAVALLAGCHDPVTEVVLVVKSDLVVPNDVDSGVFAVVAGVLRPPLFVGQVSSALAPFPISVGIVGSQSDAFSATIQLLRRQGAQVPMSPTVTRSVTGVRFVRGEIHMLVISMPSACACRGTNCPLPGVNPDCDDLVAPDTEPLDPAIAPTASPMPGGFVVPPVGGGFTKDGVVGGGIGDAGGG